MKKRILIGLALCNFILATPVFATTVKPVMNLSASMAKSGLNNTKSSLTSEQKKIVDEAKKQIGKPYVFGGKGPNSFDCSGLVQYVYKQAVNMNVIAPTWNQEKLGVEVSLNSLLPGDLVFYGNRGNTHHVGIYIGNGVMIHAPEPGTKVRTQELRYYAPQFARRILKQTTVQYATELSSASIRNQGSLKPNQSINNKAYGLKDWKEVASTNLYQGDNITSTIEKKIKGVSGHQSTWIDVHVNGVFIGWMDKVHLTPGSVELSSSKIRNQGSLKPNQSINSKVYGMKDWKEVANTNQYQGDNISSTIEKKVRSLGGHESIWIDVHVNGRFIGWMDKAHLTPGSIELSSATVRNQGSLKPNQSINSKIYGMKDWKEVANTSQYQGDNISSTTEKKVRSLGGHESIWIDVHVNGRFIGWMDKVHLTPGSIELSSATVRNQGTLKPNQSINSKVYGMKDWKEVANTNSYQGVTVTSTTEKKVRSLGGHESIWIDVHVNGRLIGWMDKVHLN